MPRNKFFEGRKTREKSDTPKKPGILKKIFKPHEVDSKKKAESVKQKKADNQQTDSRLDRGLASLFPSKKRETSPPKEKNTPDAPRVPPRARGLWRRNSTQELDTNLEAVFPRNRNTTSGRRKIGSLFGSRKSSPEGRGAHSFNTKTTGYWPAPTSQANAKGKGVAAMEGGSVDRQGNAIWPNHTLDAVEKKAQTGRLGPDDYVAVAMDASAYPYGTELRSSAYPGIPFRVVDTGSAFAGKGTAKIDIATSNYGRMDQLSASNVRFERV